MSNQIALFVGPSGSGKTTLANYLYEVHGLTQIESYTTRNRRYPGEKGHTYITDEEFDKLTDLVGYTKFDSNRYCATAAQVDANDIYVIDVAGVEFFKENYHGSKIVNVFYITAPEEDLKLRMLSRGDGGLTVARRMENDAIMFDNAVDRLKALYDNVYVVENKRVVDAASYIYQVITKEDD